MAFNKIKTTSGTWSFSVLLFLVLNFLVVTTIGATADYDVSASVAKFASDLYSKVIQDSHGNVAMSPVMLQILLTINYFGYKGDTKAALEAGLHLPSKDKEEVARKFEHIVQSLQSNPSLKFGNKLYINSNYGNTTYPNFERLSRKLGLDNEVIDLKIHSNKIFNDWIESRTNNTFPEIFNPKGKMDFAHFYISALYFNGRWSSQFNVSNTRQEPFWESETVASNVDMMHIQRDFRYSSVVDLDATAIELPFTAGNVMIIILPNKRSGLTALEQKLKGVNLNDVPGKMTYRNIDLSLPKFHIGCTIDMTNALIKMGMQDMFKKREMAELGPGTATGQPRPYNDKVFKQTSFIEVNEKGDTAGEVTNSYSANNNVPAHENPAIRVKVDHPFFYMLKNTALETILFVGRHTC